MNRPSPAVFARLVLSNPGCVFTIPCTGTYAEQRAWEAEFEANIKAMQTNFAVPKGYADWFAAKDDII